MPSAWIFSVVLLFVGWPTSAHASEISERLNKIAQSLTEAYKAKRPAVQKESLTVFSLNSSEKLTKEKVGFAISELLTQHFVKRDNFVVVERTELNRVLEEQKLQQTGAIDPDTAVQVGKLIGAHVLLLGSVEKLGGKYQVNVRFVEVAGSEVIAAVYEEFPAKLFEKEAAPYLVLVPEYQTIGFYIGPEFGPGSVTDMPSKSVLSGGNAFTVTPLNPSESLFNFALGIRYFPMRNWMVDASYATMEVLNTAAVSLPSTFSHTSPRLGKSSGFLLKLGLDRIWRWSERYRGFTGVGYMISGLEPSNLKEDYASSTGNEAIQVRRLSDGDVIEISSPYLRLGAEWKPQARFGISLFGMVYVPKESEIKLRVERFSGGAVVEQEDMVFYKLKMPTFSLQATVGLYF